MYEVLRMGGTSHPVSVAQTQQAQGQTHSPLGWITVWAFPVKFISKHELSFEERVTGNRALGIVRFSFNDIHHH